MEASVVALTAPHAQSAAAASPVPWYCITMMFAATSITVGVLWDISWHSAIGRDTFWTPAHMAIYLGGILSGLTAAWLILNTTFRGSEEARARSVKIWGMRGPYGAWFGAWGAFAMITSAPFDDWWHSAYGLDVQILSPPHAVLALGTTGVVYAALLLAQAEQSRNDSAALRWLYVFGAGTMVTNLAIFISEYTYPNLQHGATFYILCCGVFPFVLLTMSRPARVGWPVTAVAGAYMAIILLTSCILPLFPASPKLAPIYRHVDHLVPFGFPLLLIVPAIAIDLVMRRVGEDRDTLLAALLAVTFFAVFFVTHWLFSMFELSAAGDNALFMGNQIWTYFNRPGAWQHQFWGLEDGDAIKATSIVIALVLAFLSMRLGLSRGRWLRRVVR